MTDLTEQWKKGELNRNKIYYYETPFNTTDTASGFWLCNHLDVEKDKVEILREVPSYEEWKAKLEENAQLKELLKKVKDYLPEFETPMNILAKIDEVLK